MSKELERLLRYRATVRYITMTVASIAGVTMILIPNEYRTNDLTTIFLLIAWNIVFFSFFQEWAGDICTRRQIRLDEEYAQAAQDQLKRMTGE